MALEEGPDSAQTSGLRVLSICLATILEVDPEAKTNETVQSTRTAKTSLEGNMEDKPTSKA